MTRIILVRHGEVPGISPERFRGRAELPLTETGRRQASAASRCIQAVWRPVAVYSSPLGRCRDTAAAIAAPFGLAPQILAGLADIDYGSWQGLTPDEVRARWPAELEGWYGAPDAAAIPGGETLPAVRDRACAALETVRAAAPAETVVAVAHDSVNRAILLHALGAPLGNYWHIRQSPCAINEIEFDARGFVVVSMNRTGHLRGA